MSARIGADEVRHVARLARLELTDEEVAALAGQLSTIIDHAARVQSVDTEGVPVRSDPLSRANVLRDDEVRRGLDRECVLDAAPMAEAGRFRVPPILEGG